MGWSPLLLPYAEGLCVYVGSHWPDGCLQEAGQGEASLSSLARLYLEGVERGASRPVGRAGDWGQGGPSCLVGVGSEAQGLGPEAQKTLPFNFPPK